MIANLAERVKEAGVIGAGGAGFPTHVKLGSSVDTFLLNGAECEPLLFGDQITMESRANDIVSATRSIRKTLEKIDDKKVRAIIGVKKKYDSAVANLVSAIGEKKDIEILLLDNVYPAGDEQFLVLTATGRIVPEGGIPLQVGAVVMNVTTATQVQDAIDGKNVTGRLVTIGGEVDRPVVMNVPVGTKFAELIRYAGPKIDDYTLLVNGPMMGSLTDDMGEVTRKTTGGIFVLPKNHSHVMRLSRSLSSEIRIGKGSCEACRYCTDFCPRYLQGHAIEPHKIMRVMNYDRDLDVDTITSAWLCCECGVCDLWACPMALSPRVFFKNFKTKLKEAGIKNPHSNSDLTIDPQRDYRGTPVPRLVRRLGLSQYDNRPDYVDTVFAPEDVAIYLDTHIGAPAKPVVLEGAKVKCGELIAKIPDGKLGATYHASIGGVVTQVTDRFIKIEAEK